MNKLCCIVNTHVTCTQCEWRRCFDCFRACHNHEMRKDILKNHDSNGPCREMHIRFEHTENTYTLSGPDYIGRIPLRRDVEIK